MLVAEPGTVLSVTENGYGKRTAIEEFPTKGRGTKGVLSISTSERNGDQIGAVLVLPDDEIMLITEGGTLVRTTVAEIPVLSRNTQGVKLINVAGEQRLAGVERVIALNGDDDEDAEGDVELED
jgi:DNA gyrase subunit A